MKTTFATLTLGAFLLASAPSDAATILTSDGFESGIGNWSLPDPTPDEGEPQKASLYTYSGSGTNFATTGNGAVQVGTNGKRSLVQLASGLNLGTNEATSVTISGDYIWSTTQSIQTRFFMIDYSLNSGTSWSHTENSNSGWIKIKTSATETAGDFTKTLTEASVPGGAFADGVLFRIRGKADSGPTISVYFDNLVIEGEGVIPEPGSLALLGLGGLLIARRRRDR